MNERDSDAVSAMLRARGYRIVADENDCDVLLLNTCSVRQKPEDKVFSELGRIAELKALRPDMVIGVTGCMAQRAGAEIAKRAPHVDVIVGTAQLEKIPELIRTRKHMLDAGEAKSGKSSEVLIQLQLPRKKEESQLFLPARKRVTTGKLKSFVSIMYGCDKFCAFCIVPHTRGKERSRPADDIVSEVHHLAEHSVRSIARVVIGLVATCRR